MGVQPQHTATDDAPQSSRATLPITFALVGVQKAATSTIAFYLLRHRHVLAVSARSGTSSTRTSSTGTNPDYSGYTSPRRTPRQKIAGDYTPAYLFWPGALQRMHRYNPDMKLIASFRDPIERAFSQWQMDYARHEGFPQFAQAIAQDTFETVPDRVPEGWQPGDLRKRALATRGLYGAQLERAFEVYPDRSRWLLLDFIDVVTDRDTLLDRLTDFLDIGKFATRPHRRPRTPAPTSTPARRWPRTCSGSPSGSPPTCRCSRSSRASTRRAGPPPASSPAPSTPPSSPRSSARRPA